MERLERILLGYLDPSASLGETLQPAQPIEVGRRRRLGEDRDTALGELHEQAWRGRPGHAEHDERRAGGEQLVERCRGRDRPLGSDRGARGRIAREQPADPKPVGQLGGDTQIELRAPATADDGEGGGIHLVEW